MAKPRTQTYTNLYQPVNVPHQYSAAWEYRIQRLTVPRTNLPEPESAVLWARGVQFSVGAEPYTVHRPKVTLEVL